MKVGEPNKFLKIQGRVSNNVISKFFPTREFTKENTGWYFIDYSSGSYDIGKTFDTLLVGEEKKLSPFDGKIKILSVVDQFGNSLEEVPLGWQTICRLEFTPHIPKEIRNLSTLKGWEYNPDSISIAWHDEISFGIKDEIILFFTKSVAIFISFKSTELKKSDFITAFYQHFDYPVNSVKKNVDNMISLGLIKEEDEKIKIENY